MDKKKSSHFGNAEFYINTFGKDVELLEGEKRAKRTFSSEVFNIRKD